MIKVRGETESDEVRITIWDVVDKPDKDMAFIEHLQTYCVMVDAYYTPAQIEQDSYIYNTLKWEFEQGHTILIDDEILWTPND